MATKQFLLHTWLNYFYSSTINSRNDEMKEEINQCCSYCVLAPNMKKLMIFLSLSNFLAYMKGCNLDYLGLKITTFQLTTQLDYIATLVNK